MKTLGRVLVAVVVAGVLVIATITAVRYFGSTGRQAQPPSSPEMIETPAPSPPAPAVPPPPPAAPPAKAPEPVVPPAPKLPVEQAPPLEPAKAGPADSSDAKGLELADQGLALYDQGKFVEAQKTLSDALMAGVGGARGQKVRMTLADLAGRIQFSKNIVVKGPSVATCKAETGDSLSHIGAKYLIPYPLIRRINGLPDDNIRAGQILKVVQGPIHLRILKSSYELQAWLGDVCLQCYPVGLGESDSTPEGTFLVKLKLKDPQYQPQHKPQSEWRPGGARDNPLGTRWIDIGNHYGIHGTIDPAGIGGAVSEGCIRMLSKDVEEVYDMVVPGASKVAILP